MNPSVIYSQSLSNVGTGYDRLVNYADEQLGKDIKGYSGSGSYKIKSSGFSTDGNIAYKSDGKNSDVTFDIGVATTRINADVRTIKSSGSTPDIYVKADGIKGLGAMIGTPGLNPGLAKLNGRWIVIDHTFVDNLAAAAQNGSDSGSTSPTRAQVLDEARAFGEVNRQYLFSTAKDKAATKVVKKIGKETVDGHSTYHYQVALRKDNVKKYIEAQKEALKNSKLNDWLKKNHYDKNVYASFDDMAKSTKDIKDSDTYDVWMDTSQRILYKVRFKYKDNPAANYVDIGLGYKGGSDYPFFIKGKSEDNGNTSTYSYKLDVNTDTGVVGFRADDKADGSSKSEFTASLDFKPSDKPPEIKKPANAISVNEVLSILGLGGSSGAPPSGGGNAAFTIDNRLQSTSADTSVNNVVNSYMRQLTGQ